MLNRILLYWHTIRYITIRQFLGRFLAMTRRRFPPAQRKKQPPTVMGGNLSPKSAWLYHDAWNSPNDLTGGRFIFLGETASLGRPVQWAAGQQTLLWRFWLHAFNYLHLLSREEKIKLCFEWIATNPVGSQPAWHPYPLSRRIINWFKADLRDGEISQSLYQQAKYLYRSLETYLGGNHLLENARALALAGYYFAGDSHADKWLQKGLSLFEKETPKQILPDGWHYERSTMYHALMLEGYLDVLNVLPANHGHTHLFDNIARRMIDALVAATRPDGQVTLFNDATEEIAPSTANLVDYGRSMLSYEPQFRESFTGAGYYTYCDDDLFIFIDGGAIGPEHLPAHAHADIFSYEMCLLGLPFVVDTGVYEYQAGEMRDYVRNTRAHNTVCVDGVSQAECWKSFRVARRYPPNDVSYETNGRTRTFHGRFNGYSHLIGDHIQHERFIFIDPVHRSVTVDDTIHGRGTHKIENRIHLHPDLRSVVSERSVKVLRDGVKVSIQVEDDCVHSESAWYCPRMGTKLRNIVLVLTGHGELPIRLRYIIQY